jgi:ankyrin repeat protein
MAESAASSVYWQLVEKIQDKDFVETLDLAKQLKPDTDNDIAFLILKLVSNIKLCIEYEQLLEKVIEFDFDPMTNDALIWHAVQDKLSKISDANAKKELHMMLKILFSAKSIAKCLPQIIDNLKDNAVPLLKFLIKAAGQHIFTYMLDGWETEKSFIHLHPKLATPFSKWLELDGSIEMVCKHFNDKWEFENEYWCTFVLFFNQKTNLNLELVHHKNSSLRTIVHSVESSNIGFDKATFNAFAISFRKGYPQFVSDAWYVTSERGTVSNGRTTAPIFTRDGKKKIVAMMAIKNGDIPLLRRATITFDPDDLDWVAHLCYAIMQERLEIVKLFIVSNCKLASSQLDPMYYAKKTSDPSYVDLLQYCSTTFTPETKLDMFSPAKQLRQVSTCNSTYIRANEAFTKICLNGSDYLDTKLPVDVFVNYNKGQHLIAACKGFNLAMVTFLLELGAYPYDLALEAAVFNTDAKIVSALLRANSYCKSTKPRFGNIMRLSDIAVKAGNSEIIELLKPLKQEAQSKLVETNLVDILRESIGGKNLDGRFKFFVDAIGCHNPVVLDLAIKSSSMELLEYLIENGVCLDCNTDTVHPLTVAAGHSNLKFYLKLESYIKTLSVNDSLLYEAAKNNNILVFRHILTSRNFDPEVILNAYYFSFGLDIASMLIGTYYSMAGKTDSITQQVLEHAINNEWDQISEFVLS